MTNNKREYNVIAQGSNAIRLGDLELYSPTLSIQELAGLVITLLENNNVKAILGLKTNKDEYLT